MANLMYLVHRLPFPPNKGDKVRSFHLLEHLQKEHRVFLGTFLDDPADEVHLRELRARCPDIHVERLFRPWSLMRSLRGLLRRTPLSVAHFDHAGLRRWVRRVASEHLLDAVVVVSSPMAAYTTELDDHVPLFLDVVDVDSAKWARYAQLRSWPMSWLFRRESIHLLRHERFWVRRSRKAFFVSDSETRLFLQVAPECADKVQTLGNGVDTQYFSPNGLLATPFAVDEAAIVFVGSMDYWPNVNAVTWFAREVMPLLQRTWSGVVFHVVGRNPAPSVRALRASGVQVTGTVDDVRPFLQHASVVVAPMQMSPGLPNKILEAMAMGKVVVTTPVCQEAVGLGADDGLLSAQTAQAFSEHIVRLLSAPDVRATLGARARQVVKERFRWDRQLADLDPLLHTSGLEFES